ncbi:MAG: sporulation protein [Sphingomonas bacterium]|nr:tetratricopeptide repeat protein [Sphingomonas bacterium]MDB5690016.1 sporulation protein [Sphingomonas bacterium]
MTKFPGRRLCAAILLATTFHAPVEASVKDGVDAWQARDYARAVAAWRGPAAAGDPDAQFNLAQAYKLGRGVRANMSTARGLYEKAAMQGHEQAQANLGLILFQAGDRKGAMPWLQRAADRGEPRAQYVVGTAHFNGDLASKDWPRAYALMMRAAASGLPQAGRSLAEMERYIPVGQRQQGAELARGFAAEAAAEADEARATMVMAVPSPAPLPAQRAVPAPSARANRGNAAAAVRSAGVARPPLSAPAPAPIATATGGGWRIQLGAYGTAAGAQAAWTSYSSTPGLAGLRPMLVKAGAITRLQAGPLADRAAAGRACAAVVRTGKGCFPVAP